MRKIYQHISTLRDKLKRRGNQLQELWTASCPPTRDERSCGCSAGPTAHCRTAICSFQMTINHNELQMTLRVHSRLTYTCRKRCKHVRIQIHTHTHRNTIDQEQGTVREVICLCKCWSWFITANDSFIFSYTSTLMSEPWWRTRPRFCPRSSRCCYGLDLVVFFLLLPFKHPCNILLGTLGEEQNYI